MIQIGSKFFSLEAIALSRPAASLTRKEIGELMTGFKQAESSFQYFKSKGNRNITECDLKVQLLDEVVDQFETCRKAYQTIL